MKILALVPILFLIGCASTTVPVTMNFPQAPEPLLEQSESLEALPADANQISDLLQNSTINYGKYRELQLKFEQWQRWYKTNRRLHEETTTNEQ